MGTRKYYTQDTEKNCLCAMHQFGTWGKILEVPIGGRSWIIIFLDNGFFTPL